jgi:hypothetical protein
MAKAYLKARFFPHPLLGGEKSFLIEQVKDVVGVMKNNVEKVLERDNKLSDLDTRNQDIYRLEH